MKIILFFAVSSVIWLTVIRDVNAIIISNNNDDKLVVSPMELIDMIQKERSNVRKSSYRNVFTTTVSTKITTTELNDDESRLRRRKVWSRWGKWGGCSASCGGGVMVRQRECVAGHCAPGEKEEQRRPCAAPPCPAK